MDFDDQDLDDLLCDSSANKFNKSVVESVKTNGDELLQTSSTRREKKSALMAELFGPISITSLGGTADVTSEGKPSLEDSHHGNKTSGGFGSLKSLNDLPLAEEKKSDGFGLGDYFPSSGTKSSSTLKSRPSTSPNVSGEMTSHQTQKSIFGTTLDKIVPSFESWPSLPPSREKPADPLMGAPKAHHEDRTHNPLPQYPSTATATPTNGTIQDGSGSLAAIKDILHDFSESFCAKMHSLTAKNEGLTEITNCLVELQKSVSTSSQAMITSHRDDAEMAKKFILLEGKVELLIQDNAQLRCRLESAENQLRESKNDFGRMKNEAETMSADHRRIAESLRRLEAHCGEECLKGETNRRQMQDKLNELESVLAKSSSANKSEARTDDEVLRLLKSEFSWLEKQKKKLKCDRKQHQELHSKIEGKIKLMDGLSLELARTARDLQSRHLALEAKTKELEDKWTKILDQWVEKELAARKQEQANVINRSDQPMEDLGLAMWKMHVQQDEQQLLEQHHFLQFLNRT